MQILIEEDSIFCQVNLNDEDSFDFIWTKEERAQALHHAFTYEKKIYLHVVRNSKSLLSCTKFEFTDDLLEAYTKTLDLLHDLAFKNLYSATNTHVDLKGNDNVIASI